MDNKELITKLNNTINQLNSEISSAREKHALDSKKNKTTENYINL